LAVLCRRYDNPLKIEDPLVSVRTEKIGILIYHTERDANWMVQFAKFAPETIMEKIGFEGVGEMMTENFDQT